uniref:Uncharacterized protein n=2 Tax=Meloidogyne TaxID=189290 RepID=A0A914N1C5_MELIC
MLNPVSLTSEKGNNSDEKCSSISDSEKGDFEKEEHTMARSWSEMRRIWPYHTFLIVIMEFSMMLTALNNVFNLYYINVLGFHPDTTVVILNFTGILSGCCRLIGSAISDGYLGKFRAIFFGASIFVIGKIALTTSSFFPPGFPHPWLDFACVLIVIIGTSAMSPSIAPFAGDQFDPHQERMISVFYSIFYAAINIGAVISTIVMPLLRARPCFGRDSCYPLSFSVSTIGVIISFAFFFIGSKWYTKQPPKGNIFGAVYDVVKTARSNKKYAKIPKNHWLDHYFDTHICEEDSKCIELKKEKGDENVCHKQQFIEDFHCLLRLVVVLIPMPMFWALYDQQYNVWMNQALQLDSRIWGGIHLLPDQMQVVNPVLIIVLIFIFQSFIYPLAEKIVRLTPLRKMVAGGFIAAIAFFVSGIVQLRINLTLPEFADDGQAFVSIVNTFAKCPLEITHLETGETRLLLPNTSLINDKTQNRIEMFRVFLGQNNWKIDGIGDNCADLKLELPQVYEFDIKEPMSFIAITTRGAILASAETEKPTGGSGQFKIAVIMAMEDEKDGHNNKLLAFCRNDQKCNQHDGKNFYAFLNKKREHSLKFINYMTTNATSTSSDLTASLHPYIEVRPGSWKLFLLHNKPTKLMEEKLNEEQLKDVEFEMDAQGGIYALIITGTKKDPQATIHQIVPPNSVSILWQLPQIFVISVAEILVSITGLEFVYSQSGPSMKAIASACWSLTSSLGSIIIIIITLLPTKNLAVRAFLFSGAMIIDVLIFAFLAKYCYKYRKNTAAYKEPSLKQISEEVKSD